MSKLAVRGIVAVYLLVFLFGTTWPGTTLYNSATPFVLGLPFNLFVLAALVATALAVLAALYFSEKRP